ncbi:MBL fold metallo-hydrolase [Pedobacter metabolipauper]|uniref:Glyoxylase-like metal-dependent hydrolase (Beta-lactamase superfamily II) n=1 Tax=Pedobacter metabolipauper TaxID=425513 RepID=A0A4V3D0X2_9SPHI|nr:MBL fold metallo-hydrolase [Pedobacter metabolipauper]TDQ08154.1 glyoxylase-like metal-dependent hydrolase (beta-lactamase superfamily II) [Pedobacter metabolipauper]
MNLYTIETGLFKLDGGAMFGVVPKSIWQRTNPADTNNLCTWAMRCMLIEDGGRLILIDNGIGNKQDEKFLSHYYLHGDDTLDRSLAAKGFSRDDITDVFLTHLHFDHCGGSIVRVGDKLRPAFKNAFYWSNEKHWDWAVNPNDRERASFLKDNILPIQESGQLRFIEDKEGVQFHDGIHIRFAYGHTDAMMLPQIKYKDQTIVYMADLLPSTGHIPLPYVMAYDMFPLKTLTEKKSFLQEAADNKYILYLEHDPLNECCTLQQTEKGIRLDQTFSLGHI